MVKSGAKKLAEKCKAIVAEKYSSQDLNVSNLANFLGVNISYMSRAFKEAESQNISDYIMQTKIAKSCELLRETDLPIKEEIQMLSGFCDFSNYWRSFKKIMHMSPAAYRRHYGKKLKVSQPEMFDEYKMLPMSDNVDILFEKVKVDGRVADNRIIFQPIECCDGRSDGSPSELTDKRYRRMAEGGPGIIWFESTAVTEEGRAGSNQLFLHKKNIDAFSRTVDMIKDVCLKHNGFIPLVIMQTTHSGRYSAPNGVKKPIIVCHNPFFETTDANVDVVDDSYLKSLEEKYAKSAGFAQQAGFDGVDIKSCHRYLISDLLSAYLRKGEYGGSFEGRTRFLRNTVKAASVVTAKGFLITTRLNLYDGFPYPYGFGVNVNKGVEPDYNEGFKLINILSEDIRLINISIGNPVVMPHLNRPFEKGGYLPLERPVEGVKRLLEAAKEVQQRFPKLKIVCSGLSYLREKSVNLAAGAVEEGYCSFTGFGRMALAYPEFPHDIKSGLLRQRCCTLCSKCSVLLGEKQPTYCAVRDANN